MLNTHSSDSQVRLIANVTTPWRLQGWLGGPVSELLECWPGEGQCPPGPQKGCGPALLPASAWLQLVLIFRQKLH